MKRKNIIQIHLVIQKKMEEKKRKSYQKREKRENLSGYKIMSQKLALCVY